MNEKQKILIVDDKKENLVALRLVLKAVDADIVEAASGNEALTATLHNDFALGLLDVQMPGMSGFELAGYIRGELDKKPFPIIFLTAAYDDEHHMFKGYNAGGVDYITKPYSPEVLLAKVRIFLELDSNRRELEMHREHLETLVDERTYELRRETNERLRAEAAQATAESRYSELFSRMEEGFASHEIICDKAGKPVDYRFLEVNPAFERFTGLKREAIINRTALEVRPDTKPDLIEAYGHVALNQKTIHLQEIEGIPGKFFSVTVFSPRQGQFITVFSDVTERKRAEEELRLSEARLNEAQAVAKIGSWETMLPDLTVKWSAEIFRIFEIDPADFHPTHQGFLSFVHPEDREKVDAAFAASLEGKNIFNAIEHRIVTPGGRVKMVEECWRIFKDEKGGLMRAVGTCQDITDRKRSEAERRENFEMQGVLNAMLQHSLANIPLREKLKSHLEVLFGLPWLAVQPRGVIFLMNPKGGELSMAAQQGLPPQLLASCSTVPLGHCLCGRAAQTGRIVETSGLCAEHQNTYEGIKPHGHYCVPIAPGVQVLGVLNLYLREGVALSESQRRFIKHATDIMAENIIHEQTEAKLLHSQKMDSVGQLAGGVAHDFNNILTAIKCYGEFLRKDLEPQDPKLQDVKEILTAADRAVALTMQLLAFSRRQIMTPKVTDMNKCVSDMTNMLRRLIGEDLSLETKLAAAPCMVLVDTGQIEQVMANLVVNARDAMPGGGTIELSTEVLEESEELTKAHPELRRGPLVCLMVRDTGTGMTAEVKKHIFEPFFTTKEQGKGTGLGLSTVFGIVKQSGGDVEVESAPGKGTQFRIFFPCHKAALPEEEAAKIGRPAGAAKGGETVLLVEDEESLRRLARRVLETSGYLVLAAGGGAEALKELEKHGKPVDLLLTDVVMPGMTGRELARELAKRNMAGRTLYMSGYTEDAILKHGVLEENLSFIYKPFTVEGLAAKVRTVLDAPAGQARA